jgi:hypothetical protein
MLRFILGSIASFLFISSSFAATLIQSQAGTFAFEAEDYSVLTGSQWSLITTTDGLKTIPEGSNVVGDALYTHNGGSPNSFATYDLQFIADGTYYLYTRYSMYDRTTPTQNSYGNEDSFYLPRDFGLAADVGEGAEKDWYMQGLSTQGHFPSNTATPNPNEGMYFYWDEANITGTPSSLLTFKISGASVDNPQSVTFTIGNRESGVALDRFVFSTTRLSSSISGGNSSTLDGIASVPEPSRSVLMLAALGACILRRRRA